MNSPLFGALAYQPPSAPPAPKATEARRPPARNQPALLMAPAEAAEHSHCKALLEECRAGLERAIEAARVYLAAHPAPHPMAWHEAGKAYHRIADVYVEKLKPYTLSNDMGKREEMAAVIDPVESADLYCRLSVGGFIHDPVCSRWFSLDSTSRRFVEKS